MKAYVRTRMIGKRQSVFTTLPKRVIIDDNLENSIAKIKKIKIKLQLINLL